MSSVSDVLVPDMKLEDLESSLVSVGDEPKAKVDKAITDAEDAILPVRLQFNNFMQTMSNIDRMQDGTPTEKFNLIRGKVLDLTEKLQAISEDVGKLHPLFDTIPEYSEKYGTKKYHPLETLRFQQPHPAPSPQAQSNNTAGTNMSKKTSRSNDGTPVSQASTPLGSMAPSSYPGAAAAAAAAAKKPRKPRQTKKPQPSVAAAAAAAAAVANGTLKNQASPTPPTHMINAVPPPVQMVNSVPPTNMMGTPMQNMMSPLANTPNYGYPQQQLQQQPTPQQPRQQYNPPAKNNSVPPSQPMNLNNITPANILNMSMATDPIQHQQPQQAQQVQQGRKDFDPLDFNNMDFGNFNMDMI